VPFPIFRSVRLGQQPSEVLQVFLMDKAIHGGLPRAGMSLPSSTSSGIRACAILNIRDDFFRHTAEAETGRSLQ
jgi:hypothetical protein